WTSATARTKCSGAGSSAGSNNAALAGCGWSSPTSTLGWWPPSNAVSRARPINAAGCTSPVICSPTPPCFASEFLNHSIFEIPGHGSACLTDLEAVDVVESTREAWAWEGSAEVVAEREVRDLRAGFDRAGDAAGGRRPGPHPRARRRRADPAAFGHQRQRAADAQPLHTRVPRRHGHRDPVRPPRHPDRPGLDREPVRP